MPTHEPFPGYPPYLEAAAAELGCQEAAGPARRVSTLCALANLCAQASVAEASAVPVILAKAEEFRDQLQVAARAAELMLLAIREARHGLPAASTGKAPAAGRTITARANPPLSSRGRNHS